MSTKDVTDTAVVRAAVRTRASGKTTLEELAAATGEPRKVCLRAIERAVRRGFVECGVSVGTAWATAEGVTLAATGSCGDAGCPATTCHPRHGTASR